MLVVIRIKLCVVFKEINSKQYQGTTKTTSQGTKRLNPGEQNKQDSVEWR